MITGFAHYLRPSDEEYKNIWHNCIFVFDTNVLLDLYRYTTKSRDALLHCMKKISPQVWIPHQVAEEFHRNRANAIYGNNAELDKIRGAITQGFSKARNELRRQEQSIVGELIKHTENRLNDLYEELEKSVRKHCVSLEKDTVLPTLEKIFIGRIGKPYENNELEDIYKEAKQRFTRFQPPGYLDAKDKPEPQRYGDVILWRQALEQSKAQGKPLIIVTNERDEDWWHITSGKTIGPRQELIEEVNQFSGQRLLMYGPEQFLERFAQHTGMPIEDQILLEVREVSDRTNVSAVKIEVKFDGKYVVLERRWENSGLIARVNETFFVPQNDLTHEDKMRIFRHTMDTFGRLQQGETLESRIQMIYDRIADAKHQYRRFTVVKRRALRMKKRDGQQELL